MAGSDTETTTCTFCGEQFESAEVRREHEVREHPMTQVEELERLLDRFAESADRVKQLKQEKERLEDELDRLQTEQSIEETMETLQESTRRLQEHRQDRQDDLDELAGEVELHDPEDPIHVATTTDSDEVELADPDAAEENEPEIRPVNDTSASDVPPWSGFDADTEDTESPDEEVRQLHQEDATLASLKAETEDVLHRLQHRAEADDAADDGAT